MNYLRLVFTGLFIAGWLASRAVSAEYIVVTLENATDVDVPYEYWWDHLPQHGDETRYKLLESGKTWIHNLEVDEDDNRTHRLYLHIRWDEESDWYEAWGKMTDDPDDAEGGWKWRFFRDEEDKDRKVILQYLQYGDWSDGQTE